MSAAALARAAIDATIPAMSLHLLKLCVGAESISDLEEWIEEQSLLRRRMGRPNEQTHTTRMVPKRVSEIVDGGSLYWVIKGQISARQRLTEIRPFTDADGIGRCHLVMEPVVVPVEPRPCRPFQGWRYLADKDKPRDIDGRSGDLGVMPEAMRRELAELGLL
ncbi:hypothetical protein J2Y55_001636 [Bosea sp. BE125]|nr:hypothetical protein [Bosea sp. BE125]